MEVEVHDYNIADDSAKETIECKTLEKIVWGADRSNEFAESLEQLEVEDNLTELFQKEEINVDETQGFIGDSLLKASAIFIKKITVLPRARGSPKWFDHECKEERKSVRRSLRKFKRVSSDEKIEEIMWTTEISTS